LALALLVDLGVFFSAEVLFFFVLGGMTGDGDDASESPTPSSVSLALERVTEKR
jgi:hypothetical protein